MLMRDVRDVGVGISKLGSLIEKLQPQFEQSLLRVLEERAVESGVVTAQGLRDTMKSMLDPLYDELRRLPHSLGAPAPPPQAPAPAAPGTGCALSVFSLRHACCFRLDRHRIHSTLMPRVVFATTSGHNSRGCTIGATLSAIAALRKTSSFHRAV